MRRIGSVRRDDLNRDGLFRRFGHADGFPLKAPNVIRTAPLVLAITALASRSLTSTDPYLFSTCSGVSWGSTMSVGALRLAMLHRSSICPFDPWRSLKVGKI